MNITFERATEILNKYNNEKKHDLFNWCDEYDQFINNAGLFCVSSEWDYILKKSYDDEEAPFSYEDLDLFSPDLFMERLEYEFKQCDDNLKNEIIETLNADCKTWEELKLYLADKDNDELKNYLNDLESLIDIDISQCETEVYEWYLLGGQLSYKLEKQGEVFLNNAWGRCGTGQSVKLDYCCIKAFISMLEDITKRN